MAPRPQAYADGPWAGGHLVGILPALPGRAALRRRRRSVREPGLISDPKVNFSYFEIAMGRYGEVWARRNVYSAPPRYYKCTATHATPI